MFAKDDKNNTKQYSSYSTANEFLEILKIEFSDFIRFAESGKTIRYQGLKARKKSMRLRELIKLFRPISIKQERKITEIVIVCLKRSAYAIAGTIVR